MPKAYDRMEWIFIEETLKSMSFHTKFIDIIMECASSLSYSVLVNGSPYEKIFPSKGLRRGDSLFPYFFIVGMKVFSQMLIRVESAVEIHGATIVTKGPSIYHLFFANDSFVFL